MRPQTDDPTLDTDEDLTASLAGPVVAGCDMAESGLIGVAVVGRDPADSRRLICAHVDGLRVGKVRTILKLAQVQTDLLDRVVELAKEYHAEVAVDQYASKRVRAHFTDQGVRCKLLQQGAASKDRGYRELRDRLYDGSLVIPDDGPLLADLRRLRTRTSSTGASTVVNPRIRGEHGDRASALVLAVQRQVEHGLTTPQGRPSGGPPGGTLLGDLPDQTYRRGGLRQGDLLGDNDEELVPPRSTRSSGPVPADGERDPELDKRFERRIRREQHARRGGMGAGLGRRWPSQW